MFLFTVIHDSKNLGSLQPEDCGQILITYSGQSLDCVCLCLCCLKTALCYNRQLFSK